jgi:hypothetical protein
MLIGVNLPVEMPPTKTSAPDGNDVTFRLPLERRHLQSSVGGLRRYRQHQNGQKNWNDQ